MRVASQLYTYSVSDMVEKWGFENPPPPVQPQSSASNIKLKTASEKFKGSARRESPQEVSSSNFIIIINKITFQFSFQEIKDEPGTPLYDEEGKPVFIIVEVELWKPYIPKKSPEFLHER